MFDRKKKVHISGDNGRRPLCGSYSNGFIEMRPGLRDSVTCERCIDINQRRSDKGRKSF